MAMTIGWVLFISGFAGLTLAALFENLTPAGESNEFAVGWGFLALTEFIIGAIWLIALFVAKVL